MTSTTTPPGQDAVESEFRGGESAVRRRRFASAAPPRAPLRAILVATLTCLGGLTVLVGLGTLSGHVLLIPSLAGTMALVAGAPHLPLSQPRNLLLGQALATGAGLGVGLVSHSLWAAAAAASLALLLMLLSRAAHSPATATAVLGTSTVSGRGSFVLCVLTAAVAIVLVAVVRSRAGRGDYPVYWW